MYKYIKTDNPPLLDIMEVGKDLVLDICEMLPAEFEKNIDAMRNAIQEYNYEVIERGAHSIKSNLKIFMDRHSPAVEYSYGLEQKAHILKVEKKENGFVQNPVDFSEDIEKLVEITKEPIEEIIRFGEEYKNNN
jgi:HPt (histidine-containing phosphotransfer) domain-containing protein